MAAERERFERDIDVATGRRKDMDDIESFGCHDPKRGVRCDAEPLRDRLGTRRIKVSDADDADIGKPLQRLDMKFADVTCADKADAIDFAVCHFRLRTAS